MISLCLMLVQSVIKLFTKLTKGESDSRCSYVFYFIFLSDIILEPLLHKPLL